MPARKRRWSPEVMYANSAGEWIAEDVKDGWHVQAWFEPREGVPCLVELRVRSASGSTLSSAHGPAGPRSEYPYHPGRPVPPRGITSDVLRGLSLKAFHGALGGDEGRLARALGVDPSKDYTRARRPGRKGHDPAFYAEWARRYVETCETTRQPYQPMAEEYDYSPDTIRDYVQGARERGLLVGGSPGRAGGRLSAKAQRILDKQAKGDAP